MWIPNGSEQCTFLRLLASLSDLKGHGILGPPMWRVCKMPAPAMCVSRAPWPSFQLVEYAFDHIVLMKWLLADLLISLQLQNASTSFLLGLTDQSFLFTTYTSCYLLIDRTVHHFFTLHLFFPLAIAPFHLSIQLSHGVHLATSIRCRCGNPCCRKVHRHCQKEPIAAWNSEAPRA
jgi:hypothetical protein